MRVRVGERPPIFMKGCSLSLPNPSVCFQADPDTKHALKSNIESVEPSLPDPHTEVSGYLTS